MKKQILEDIKDMKYLLNYNRGRVLSEQQDVNMGELTLDEYELEEEDLEEEVDYLAEDEIDFEMTTMPGTKEREKTITTPGVKPGKKPGTPYSPKPGPKKNPKAEKRMPNWLSFDEIGIDFE